MEIKSYIICSCCKKVILPLKGKIFKGNVYMVGKNVNDRGGLIGSSNYKKETTFEEAKSSLQKQIEETYDEIAYWSEKIVNRIKATNNSNKWIQQLRDSLEDL